MLYDWMFLRFGVLGVLLFAIVGLHIIEPIATFGLFGCDLDHGQGRARRDLASLVPGHIARDQGLKLLFGQVGNIDGLLRDLVHGFLLTTPTLYQIPGRNTSTKLSRECKAQKLVGEALPRFVAITLTARKEGFKGRFLFLGPFLAFKLVFLGHIL